MVGGHSLRLTDTFPRKHGTDRLVRLSERVQQLLLSHPIETRSHQVFGT